MTTAQAAPAIRVESARAGTILRIVIDRPRGNVLTRDVMNALRTALGRIEPAWAAAARVPPHTTSPAADPSAPSRSHGIKLVTIEGAGEHFSFGASVEEHAPDLVAHTLDALHLLVRELLDVPAPTAAIVRGQCLGGGLEVVLACDLVFAADDASLGLPEVSLGVFPPLGAALLPARIGSARAATAVISGQALPASWWADAGLVHRTAPASELDARVADWFEAHLADRSAAALRFAAAATRWPLRHAVEEVLPDLERLYLRELMQTEDAIEGVQAFIEKRKPVWMNR
jgi:cyclohexa-1,5-dienecarbonyl-CoA hydratase